MISFFRKIYEDGSLYTIITALVGMFILYFIGALIAIFVVLNYEQTDNGFYARYIDNNVWVECTDESKQCKCTENNCPCCKISKVVTIPLGVRLEEQIKSYGGLSGIIGLFIVGYISSTLISNKRHKRKLEKGIAIYEEEIPLKFIDYIGFFIVCLITLFILFSLQTFFP